MFIGFRPNTGIIEGHVDHDEMDTFAPTTTAHVDSGLFAAGDVRAQLTRQVTTAVGDATTATIAVEKYLKALRDGDREPVIQEAIPREGRLGHRRTVSGEHLPAQ